MTKKLSLVVAGLVTMTGCDGGPTNPTPQPSSVAVAISIAPATDLIKIKSSESFSATTTSANGTPQAATATWSSDNPAVASVEPAGRTTGNASGRATISAQVEGLRATINLRVVPDYHGRWQGVTRLTGCTAEGDFAGACADAIGGDLALTLAVSQNRDAIAGDVDFDGARGPVSTSVQVDGRLVTTGALTLAVDGITFNVALSEWNTATTDNQRMTGRFGLDIRHPLLSGFWRLEGDLASIQKTAGTPTATLHDQASAGQSAGSLARRLKQVVERRR
jgi:hypothetical protein